jgi:signal transduction histidine kinase
MLRELNKFTEIGINSSTLLLSLIEDILDLSKIEAGTFVVNRMNFRLSEIVYEIKGIFSYQSAQKRIEFKTVINEIVRNSEVFSDKGRIKQILLNLISNSMKFTFKGSISLNIFTGIIHDEEFLIFEVKDTGIGIKNEHKPKLFKLFGTITETREHNLNGTGIGLTVWKKYCEKLGGGIELESEYQKGTNIVFWVPFVKPDVIRNSNQEVSMESERHLIANEYLNSFRENRWSLLKKDIWVCASREMRKKNL